MLCNQAQPPRRRRTGCEHGHVVVAGLLPPLTVRPRLRWRHHHGTRQGHRPRCAPPTPYEPVLPDAVPHQHLTRTPTPTRRLPRSAAVPHVWMPRCILGQGRRSVHLRVVRRLAPVPFVHTPAPHYGTPRGTPASSSSPALTPAHAYALRATLTHACTTTVEAACARSPSHASAHAPTPPCHRRRYQEPRTQGADSRAGSILPLPSLRATGSATIHVRVSASGARTPWPTGGAGVAQPHSHHAARRHHTLRANSYEPRDTTRGGAKEAAQ